MTDNKLTIKEYIAAPQVQQKMAEMFTDKRLLDGFVQSVIAISGSDELLAVAEPRSVFNACLTAASLNLPINKNLGFAHIIGYRNNKKNGIVEAQFQLGARGFRELAQRSGQYMIINQGDVREGELIGRDRLSGELKFNWIDDDAEREKKPIIGYFSYFKLQNGFSSTLYMSKDEIIAHGKRYSQSFKRGYGPWVDNFDAMALKTVSKLNISKNGPLSVDMQKAVQVDQAVIHGEDKLEYIDGNELENVDASDDEKAAIIEAHAAEAEVVKQPKGSSESSSPKEQPSSSAPKKSPSSETKAASTTTTSGSKPKVNVKEEAQKRWGKKPVDDHEENLKQAGLLDDNNT